jgi:hypothetical protein
MLCTVPMPYQRVLTTETVDRRRPRLRRTMCFSDTTKPRVSALHLKIPNPNAAFHDRHVPSLRSLAGGWGF